METPLDPDIVQHAMKVERTAAQGNDPQAYTPATELKSLKPWTMLALAALGAVIISLWTWHWQMAMTAILLVTLCVEIKILRRVRESRRLLDGVAMPVPHRSTEPGRPRHRREMS